MLKQWCPNCCCHLLGAGKVEILLLLEQFNFHLLESSQVGKMPKNPCLFHSLGAILVKCICDHSHQITYKSVNNQNYF